MVSVANRRFAKEVSSEAARKYRAEGVREVSVANRRFAKEASSEAARKYRAEGSREVTAEK